MTTSQNGGKIAVTISQMYGSRDLHHAAHSFLYKIERNRF